MSNTPVYDLAIIGGGINGTAIARDAAGRGLKVYLCEQNDLASATSSASSKLIHGGLRYLEHYEFRLVHEALAEREILLRTAPHIIHPLRFILPYHKGNRPYLMLWAGLKLYDALGFGSSLPRSVPLSLTKEPNVRALMTPDITKALTYYDAYVDDSRLTVLCALDAYERGAAIHTRTKCTHAQRHADHWELRTHTYGREETVKSRVLVNAAGAHVDALNRILVSPDEPNRTRLVQGSHIIVPRLYEFNDAFILQNSDNRIVFLIPFEQDYTLIGTTDIEVSHTRTEPRIGFDEKSYLLESVNRYLARPLIDRDIIGSYSGIRTLYDDKHSKAQHITRDYVLHLNQDNGLAPVLSVYGGKITTHRMLAEKTLEKLHPFLRKGTPWTAHAFLPGGDFPPDGYAGLLADLQARYPYLASTQLERLIRHYGTRTHVLLHDVKCADDMGEDLGCGFTHRELDYLMSFEWAHTIKDILWRRTKLGLHLSPEYLPRLYALMSNGNQKRRIAPTHNTGSLQPMLYE